MCSTTNFRCCFTRTQQYKVAVKVARGLMKSAMKRIAKRKVLTPGRLTGGASREQHARKRATTTPGQDEPAYSLYSSDPKEQVDSLHLGLDRCAALLSGILQVHNAEPSVRPLKAAKAAKPKPSTPLQRKTSRKPPTKTEQYCNVAPEAQCLPPVSHSGVKQNHALIQPHLSPSLRVRHPLPGYAHSQPDPAPRSSSGRLTPAQTDRQPPGGQHTASFNGEEVDAEPVKDRDTQMFRMQEELTLAQSRLQELQVDLAEVKKSLLDTKKQLQDTEAENMLIKSELETIRTKLVHSEQAKSRLASLAQHRLEQIENLQRIIQSGSDTVGLSLSDTAPREKLYDRNSATEHITKYLTTLRQSESSHAGGHVHLATESEGNEAEEAQMSSALLRKVSSHPNQLDEAHCVAYEGVPLSALQIGKARRRLFDSFLSLHDADSVSSDCSGRSVSTFDTKDEVAFQDGLAALDASIASLQKTIQLDLAR
ncbi:uncharacterized protein ccdc14 isoform X1 [Dunckerocampus dactyliophorus]|uniref:uncharacterized protein ccdc14 isoform X1 n=1 Tax=Dunckerocampus dactyliophorus TaxID=161453 RepID=UPI0024057063|nr:uncharacterized protein ccdc14 isoform X1 [Dunckerocampus dactyliophorus]